MFLIHVISLISFLSHPWSVPFVFACICLFLQIVHILFNTFRKPGSVIETESALTDSDTVVSPFLHSIKQKVKSHGGWTIYLFMMARLFGCFVLFALSVNSLLGCQRNHPDKDKVGIPFKHLFLGCPEALMTVTFVNPLSFILSYLKSLIIIVLLLCDGPGIPYRKKLERFNDAI